MLKLDSQSPSGHEEEPLRVRQSSLVVMGGFQVTPWRTSYLRSYAAQQLEGQKVAGA